MPIEMAGPVVFHWAEQGAVQIAPMSRNHKIVLDHPLGCCVDRDEADLLALSFDTKMHHPLAAVQVFDLEPAEFFTADAMIKQGGQNGAVAHTFERVGQWRFQQLARLTIAQSRRTSFIAVGHWTLDTVHRVAGDGVAFTEVIEEGGQG
jgi:hypothetical protein